MANKDFRVKNGLSVAGAGSIGTTLGVGTNLSVSGTTTLTGNILSDVVISKATAGLRVDATSGWSTIYSDGSAGQGRVFGYLTDGVLRWRHIVEGTAESGSNAGSSYVLQCFDDSGNFLYNAHTISRGTGVTTDIKFPHAAYSSTNLTGFTNGSLLVVKPATLVSATGSNYSTSTGLFSTPSSGIYSVGFYGSGSASGSGSAYGCVYINGVQDLGTIQSGSVSAFGWYQAVNWTGYLAGGQTIGVYVSQGSGATCSLSKVSLSFTKISSNH